MSSSVVQDDRIDQDQEPEPDEPQAVGLTSIYPAVPNLYKRFTKANLNKLQILQSYQLKEDEPPWEELTPELRIKRQNQILSEATQQQDEQQQDADAATTDKEATQPLDFDLLSSLAPPRADWILEDGFFYSFGDRWPLPDIFPTLEETGIQQLYPKDLPIDRRKILSNLLKTLLSTHLELTTLLLSPPNYYQVTQLVPVGPPIQSQDGSWKEQLGEVEMVRTEAMDKWEHIRTVVINFQYLVNECRPMQFQVEGIHNKTKSSTKGVRSASSRHARETLKQTLRTQITRRKAQTELLKSKSREMRESIKAMRASMGLAAGEDDDGSSVLPSTT